MDRRTHAGLTSAWDEGVYRTPDPPIFGSGGVFGVTRNILLNRQRGEHRRRALGVRLADAAAFSCADLDTNLVVSRVDLSKAWSLLSEVHQEALGLAVFEDLRSPQAAAVLGISPVAFRLRLSRARRALRLHLDHLPHPSGKPAGVSERTTSSGPGTAQHCSALRHA